MTTGVVKATEKYYPTANKTQSQGSNGELILTTLVGAADQYKIFHWQTKSFSQHQSFDGVVNSLREHTDELIEAYQGRYGRIFATSSFKLGIENFSTIDVAFAYTDKLITFLVETFPTLIDPKCTDLLNIRDEILGNLYQLKFLLSLV
jgi:DNA-binding ferritin-like protein